MDALRRLLEEYEGLGSAEYSSPHDHVLRQRKLEAWAGRARDVIADLLRQPRPDTEPQASFVGEKTDELRETGS